MHPQTASLFDHLVSQGAARWRNFQSKELGGLVIDHQFEFGRLFHGQIGRFSAFRIRPT